MKKLRGLALLLPVIATQMHATVYYIGAGGNDNNAGTNINAPWATLANLKKKCTTAGAAHPGDFFLLQRGNKWRDELKCGSTYTSKAGDTLTSSPPVFSGSPGNPITIAGYGMGADPIIDAADPLDMSQESNLGGGVYMVPLGAAGMPAKVFLDGENTDTTQLLPVPNAAGEYSTTTIYDPLDLVTYGAQSTGVPNYYVHGMDSSTIGNTPGPVSNNWTSNFYNVALYTLNNVVYATLQCANGCNSQLFSTTNTGLQNVQQIPGSWYSDGVNLWIHLPDGSDPANHRITGTYRNTNISVFNGNWISIDGIQGAHAQKTGIGFYAYSDSQGGTYNTNENNFISHVNVFNWGDITSDTTVLQSGTGTTTSIMEAGVMIRADGGSTAHLLQGDRLTQYRIGMNDAYNGIRGGASTYTAGVYLLGMDGGGTANNLIADHGRIQTHNARGLVFNTDRLGGSGSGGLLNNGGRLSWLEMVDNQANLFFGFMHYGRVDHLYIHNSYGEGIQLGGSSIGPYLIDHNVIANLSISNDYVGYNHIDCNGTAPDGEFANNTLHNPWGGAVTQEIGCQRGFIHDNIITTRYNLWPNFSIASGSNAYYYNISSFSGQRAGHNYFFLTTSIPHPFQVAGGTAFSTAQYPAGWPDATSVFGGDPQFVAPEVRPAMRIISYRLLPTSPAYTVGTNGNPAGAYDNTADTFDEKLVGPTSGSVGRVYGHLFGGKY